ncbi:MAG: hypothetical protein JSS53_08595 [Proteobacteria bacterium]|nr:hypothetical protein [Pseudomonadota bacterium]
MAPKKHSKPNASEAKKEVADIILKREQFIDTLGNLYPDNISNRLRKGEFFEASENKLEEAFIENFLAVFPCDGSSPPSASKKRFRGGELDFMSIIVT